LTTCDRPATVVHGVDHGYVMVGDFRIDVYEAWAGTHTFYLSDGPGEMVLSTDRAEDLEKALHEALKLARTV
jgi:hypothetical protein